MGLWFSVGLSTWTGPSDNSRQVAISGGTVVGTGVSFTVTYTDAHGTWQSCQHSGLLPGGGTLACDFMVMPHGPGGRRPHGGAATGVSARHRDCPAHLVRLNLARSRLSGGRRGMPSETPA